MSLFFSSSPANGSRSFGLLFCKMESIESALLSCYDNKPRVVVRTVHILNTYYLPGIFQSTLHTRFQLILITASFRPWYPHVPTEETMKS